MLLDKVIEPDSLRSTDDRLEVGLRLPWYRALPLSTVEIDSLTVDGELLDRTKMKLAVDGVEYPVDTLPQHTDCSWFVIDTATLSVDGFSLPKGSTHEVEVIVSLYPPYIRGLRRAVRWAREMEVK
jgi:hypothetical protein